MPFIIEAERYEIVDYNAMLVYMMQFPIFESPKTAEKCSLVTSVS